MPTDPVIDPSEETPEKEPPPSSDPQPSEPEPTETVEELKEKLAAAETETKRWKGRVEKANVSDTRSDEIKELEWKLENKGRITLVQEEFDKILAEGYQGEKVSKKIALELAEKQAKIDTSSAKRNRQDDNTSESVTARNENVKGYASEEDREIGLTIEKKRKLEARHPHLKGK